MKNQVMFDRAPVHAIAQRRQLVNCGTALFTAAALLLAAIFALALLDAKYAWAEPLRQGLAVLTGAAALAVLAGRWLKGRKGHDAATVIREMEATNPAGGQQLRTAWEVADKGVPMKAEGSQAEFSRKLLLDAQLQVQGGKWGKLAPSGSLLGWLAGCVAVAAGIFVMAQQSPDFRLALRRTVLPSGAPTFTTVEWSANPANFDDRHPPRLAVTLAGRQAEPRLEVRTANAREWESRPLTALADGRTYDAVLTGLTGDFQARVTAGDGSTTPHAVHYRPIPRLEEAKVTVNFPDYTGRAPEERPGADVHAVEGSILAWNFRFNTPPDRVEWKLAAGTMEPVSVPLEKKGEAVTATWQAPRGKFSGVLTVFDDDGSTVDSWKYEIAAVPDALPKVELLEPVKDSEATSVTELPVRIRARDDFGVAEIGLIMEAAGQTLWTMEKVIAEKDHADISELTRAMLETVPLTIRDNVKLYAYALDHKPRGGPRAVSALRAIDIRDFKKRERYLGKQKGPPVSPEQVIKLNELIMAQRVVVSDCHIVKEEARDELADGIPQKCQETSNKETGVITKTGDLLAIWQDEPSIPRDDVTLLRTASVQMQETQRYLARLMTDQSHVSSDRALTTLIQIRKHLMKLIMESDTPCDCESEPSDLKELEAFAKEAERLANEEKSVREQIAPGAKKEIASLESSRRQQEVAVADVGELFAGIVKHPKKNEGMERLMAAAETTMRDADSQLHTDDVLTATAPLSESEQTLRDLADFIRAMNEDKLADTLTQMANKAKGDAKKAGEKKEGQENGDEKEMAAAGKKPGKPGASGSGSSPGEGDKPGEGPPDSPTAEAAKTAKEAARNTALADAILKALEERAGGGQKPGEGEDKGEGEKPSSGMSAEALAALRERLGTEALARELKELAGGAQAGEGPGKGEGEGQDPVEGRGKEGDIAGRLDNMANELAAEASRLKASRLAKLADMRTKARELQKKASADDAVQEAEEEKKMIQKYLAMGVPPGATIRINGKMITLPKPGDGGAKPGSGTTPGNSPGQGLVDSGANGNSSGMGPALGRFAAEARRLDDEPITGWAMQLQTEVPEMIVPSLDGIIQRLDVLIAALPGGAQPVTAQSRVPEANRREVEAYFRNLSDDFGDEQ